MRAARSSASLAVRLAVLGGLACCGLDWTVPDGTGGAGGAGAQGGGGAGGAGGAGTSGGGGAASGGGGGSACGGTCTDCVMCAVQGTCMAQFDDCQGDGACSAILTCGAGCGFDDYACVQDCVAANPAGQTLFEALANCVVCGPCASSCAGAPWPC